jgi:hypothetical protein
MRASSGVLDNQDAKLTELTLLTVRGTLSIIDMYRGQHGSKEAEEGQALCRNAPSHYGLSKMGWEPEERRFG